MKLYYNPLSSFSQKVVIAFYEKDIQFTPEIVDIMNPATRAEYEKTVNTFGKIPTLVLDNGHKVPESSIIIEYLEGHHPKSGTRLIPEDIDAARQARFLDRFFDLYVNEPMAKIFFDGMKPEADRDPKGVAAAKVTLDKAYAIAEELLASRTWAVGDSFTMADCSAAPALGYARMVYPFEQHKNVVSYANRLAERPSITRVRTEAAPFMARMMSR
jgi:glutathione S-transferase